MTDQIYRMWLEAAERARHCHEAAISALECPNLAPDAVAWQQMSAYYARQARNLAGRE